MAPDTESDTGVLELLFDVVRLARAGLVAQRAREFLDSCKMAALLGG
jgi:hypothetical protein